MARRAIPSLVPAAAIIMLLAAGRGGPPAAASGAELAALAEIPACAGLGAGDFSSLPDAPATISSAAVVDATATAPAYCKVSGTIGPSQFVLQLPAGGWDGRYFESGCGGYCGSLNPNADCQTAFSRGAAIGYSDLGHEGSNPNDMSWAENQDQRLAFAYLANHQLVVVAKAIIAAFYDRGPAHSYFSGCSDGGREALMEAQRFPDDFDGIIAGAPAYLLAFLNSFKHTWQYQATTDAQGNPIFTAAKAALLHSAVPAACDALDGAIDGLIFDPRACAFDPGALLCPDAVDAPDCLTGAQVDAARRAYSSPVDAGGVAYYPGGVLPYGSELRWAGGGPPGGGGSFDKSIADAYLGYLSLPLQEQDTSWNADTLRYSPQDFAALLPMASVYDASNPDLSAFRDRGGKLILYHGWADDSISPFGTIAYYAALQRQMGGLDATQQFARLFMFPGVYHCSGGEGPSHWDMVTAITDWVEGGVAPAEIVATQYETDLTNAGGGFANPTDLTNQAAGAVVRTLPAFPYPLEPNYTGSGDANDARNYVPVPSAYTAGDDFNWIGRGVVSAPPP